MKNIYIALAIVVALVFGVLIGYVIHPQQTIQVGSATGSTFGTAKFAGVVVNLANQGQNGTSTSLVNTDTSDRYIDSLKLGCESVGLGSTNKAALTMSVATTTTANPAAFAYNQALALNYGIATGTPNFIMASSTTIIATSTDAMLWRSGEILTFWFNATNTAVCTVGVGYIGS